MAKKISLTSIAIGREIKRRGLTQTEVAKKLRRNVSTMHGWSNGSRSPKCDDIPKIAKAIGCRVTDLIPDIEPKVQPVPVEPPKKGI